MPGRSVSVGLAVCAVVQVIGSNLARSLDALRVWIVNDVAAAISAREPAARERAVIAQDAFHFLFSKRGGDFIPNWFRDEKRVFSRVFDALPVEIP